MYGLLLGSMILNKEFMQEFVAVIQVDQYLQSMGDNAFKLAWQVLVSRKIVRLWHPQFLCG